MDRKEAGWIAVRHETKRLRLVSSLLSSSSMALWFVSFRHVRFEESLAEMQLPPLASYEFRIPCPPLRLILAIPSEALSRPPEFDIKEGTMDCILRTDEVDADMTGPAGKDVTLKLIPNSGATGFIAAVHYDGKSSISADKHSFTYTLPTGRAPLGVTFAVTGNATLVEDCDDQTVIDAHINPSSNVRPYFVRGVQ